MTERDCKLCRCGMKIPRLGPSSCPPCESRRQSEHDSRSGRERNFYSSARWKSARSSYLRANPLCCECEKRGRTEVATDVDHVIPLSAGGAPFDPANFQALCHGHHSAKTIRELNAKRRAKREDDKPKLSELNRLRTYEKENA